MSQTEYSRAKELVDSYKFRAVARITAQCDEFLDSFTSSVRSTAINTLKGFEVPNEKIEDTLLHDPDPYVRIASIKYIKEVRPANIYMKLVPLLSDRNDDVVIAAIEAIYWMTAEVDLKKFLHHSSPKVRLATLRILQEEVEEEDLQKLREDSDKKVKNLALNIQVERSNDPEYLTDIFNEYVVKGQEKSVMLPILTKLAAHNPEHVLNIVKDILELKGWEEKDKNLIPAILKFFPQEVYAKVVTEIVEEGKEEIIAKLILGYVKCNVDAPSKVIVILSDYALHENPKIREMALKGLAKLGETSTIEIFRSAVTDEDEKVRAAAVSGMSLFLDFKLEEMIDDLIKDHSKYVRKAAVRAISKLRLEDHYMDVADLLTDSGEDKSVLSACMNAAGKLKMDCCIKPLSAIINKQTETLKMKELAAEALLKISPETVLDILG